MSLGASRQPHDPMIGGGVDGDGDHAPVPAAYDGGWIGDVIPGLLAGRAPHGLPAHVTTARPVVVLLVDGLGWNLWRRFADLLPALAEFTGGPVTSVVPSTTAAALPSLTTGTAPAEHGMLGDRIRVGGATLNVLQWTVSDGTPPAPAAVQPHPPFGGARVPVVSNTKFEGSGFSSAHLRGAPFFGYAGAAGLPDGVARALRGGAPLVFAYLPDADRIAHEHGFAHDAFVAALRLVDGVVRGVRRVLPTTGTLVVTADHGHVEVDPAQKVDMTPLAPLLSGMSGSARLRYLHARAGAVRELLPAARELVGARAWVLDRTTLLDTGWLGPRPAPLVAGRLGDVTLAARGAATMVDPAEGRVNSLRTVHGSVTADEMLVPLLHAPGLAPA